MKRFLLALSACAMMATSADAMYIIGQPATTWSPSVGIEMQEVDGGWKWTGVVGENDYFAFATELDMSGDWSNFNANFRISPNDGDGTAATEGTHAMHLGAPDCAFKGTGYPVTYLVKEDGNGGYTLEVTNDKMYIIGALTDPMWSPAAGIEMEAVSGGWQWSGTVGENDYFTFATALEPSGNWDIFNQNYRLSPDGGDGTEASVGIHGMHFGAPEAAFRGIGLPVTYFVSIDSNGNYYLKVTGEGGSEEVWSVIGAFTNWSEDVDMAQTAPGIWRVTMEVLEGEFKFRKNHEWGVNYGAPEGDSTEVEPGTEGLGIALSGANFWIAPSFRVTLTLDLNAEILYATLPKPMGMRGSFNDWGWNDEYLFVQKTPGIFTLNMENMKSDWEFKVSNDDWSENYSTDIFGMLADTNYSLFANVGNMSLANDYKNVVWTLNLLDNTISFTGDIDTSVAEIETSEDNVRYYNLQGVEVEKPVNGLYIRVANGKSEKVLVK